MQNVTEDQKKKLKSFQERITRQYGLSAHQTSHLRQLVIEGGMTRREALWEVVRKISVPLRNQRVENVAHRHQSKDHLLGIANFLIHATDKAFDDVTFSHKRDYDYKEIMDTLLDKMTENPERMRRSVKKTVLSLINHEKGKGF